jgi:hypothetical protein
MADIVKRVRTEYTTSGLLLGAGKMRKLGTSADKASRRVDLLKGRLVGLGRVARGLVMGGGLLGGLGAVGAAAGLFKIATAAQDSQLALTGLIQKSSELHGGTAKSFDAASAAAVRAREQFIKLAEASPVTSKAIEESFKGAHMVLSSMGISQKEQIGLARSVSIAQAGMKASAPGTAARDVAQLLRGQFSEAEISTPQLSGSIGKGIAKAAKSGKVKKAMGLLNKALTPSPELLKAHQESATGLMATMQDQLTLLAQSAGKPIMEFASEKLKEWNKWLKKNRSEARRIARAIGSGIVGAAKTLIGLVKGVAEHWDTIVGVVKTLTGIYMAKLVFQLGTLVSKSIDFARNMAAGVGVTKAGRGTKLLGGLAAAGAGSGVGQRIHQLAGTGVQADLLGMTADLLTGGSAGGMTFGTTKAEAAQNRRIMAQHEAAVEERAAKRAKRKDLNEGKEGEYKGSKGGRGGRGGGAKVSKMEVDRFEVRGSDLVRAMAPMTRQIDRSLRKRAPRTALFGLGSLTVANGGE